MPHTSIERDYEVLRGWALNGLFCQWTITLSSGHDVSEESLFLQLKYSIFSKKKKRWEVSRHKWMVRMENLFRAFIV